MGIVDTPTSETTAGTTRTGTTALTTPPSASASPSIPEQVVPVSPAEMSKNGNGVPGYPGTPDEDEEYAPVEKNQAVLLPAVEGWGAPRPPSNKEEDQKIGDAGYTSASAMRERNKHRKYHPPKNMRVSQKEKFYALRADNCYAVIAQGWWFEQGILAVIILNGIWIGVDVDHNPEDTSKITIFDVMEQIFTVLFTLEIYVRLRSYKKVKVVIVCPFFVNINTETVFVSPDCCNVSYEFCDFSVGGASINH